MEPNKPALRAWVERLRSGEDQQGASALCTRYEDGTEQLCCLGVVTKMNAEALGLEETEGPRDERNGKFFRNVRWNGEQAVLPRAVQRFLGVGDENFHVTDPAIGYKKAIAAMNDSGATFAELADAIEAEFDL